MPMNIALQDINWDSQLQDLDLAQSWSYFAETLIELIENIYTSEQSQERWREEQSLHYQKLSHCNKS